MKIGSWFKDCDKIQKSVRRDPHRHIPFHETMPIFRDKIEKYCVIGIVVMVFIYIGIIWTI